MATSTEFSKPLNQDISEKADKVLSATNGHFAGLDSNGNLTDSGKSATDFVGASSFYATEMPISSSDSTKVSQAIANTNSKIATYQFGTVASLSAFVTALNTYVSGMWQYDFKNIVVEFSATSTPFTAARYIGTVSRTTSARAQVLLQLHNGQQVIHGIQNESAWDWQELALNRDIANVATDVANSAFCVTGASGSGATSVSITLPVGALFDSLHPIFVISIYRTSATDSNEGYCVMKIDGTSVYITRKTGMENVTGATYNSTTRVLTITCGAYRTFLVFGQRTLH